MSGARSPSNRLHLHRPREPSRVHAGECAPSAQRARGLFGRVSSRHGAARKDARPPCLSLTRRITTVSHPCQRQRRAKRRAALNPRDPTSIQTPSTVKVRLREAALSWAGLLRYGPVIAVLPSGAPPIAVPPPRRAAFVSGIGGLRGEKMGAEGEINPFAPDSVPFLALPPVPSGGGG